jgi:hypothetical protein
VQNCKQLPPTHPHFPFIDTYKASIPPCLFPSQALPPSFVTENSFRVAFVIYHVVVNKKKKTSTGDLQRRIRVFCFFFSNRDIPHGYACARPVMNQQPPLPALAIESRPMWSSTKQLSQRPKANANKQRYCAKR